MTGIYIEKRQFAGKKVELSDISIRDGLQSLPAKKAVKKVVKKAAKTSSSKRRKAPK